MCVCVDISVNNFFVKLCSKRKWFASHDCFAIFAGTAAVHSHATLHCPGYRVHTVTVCRLGCAHTSSGIGAVVLRGVADHTHSQS